MITCRRDRSQEAEGRSQESGGKIDYLFHYPISLTFPIALTSPISPSP
ncbi:hypothetical protein V0288_08510 [Pannus brasiliensis CCIBt3594]|uniref:Uncharacterized protein n=1 Tax=Pannus brasiliensis CCIBt3594 TaxID=1427578 RepID=A0AAW9QJ84_9CHRO